MGTCSPSAGQPLPLDLAGNWDLQVLLRNGSVSLRDKTLRCLVPLETTLAPLLCHRDCDKPKLLWQTHCARGISTWQHRELGDTTAQLRPVLPRAGCSQHNSTHVGHPAHAKLSSACASAALAQAPHSPKSSVDVQTPPGQHTAPGVQAPCVGSGPVHMPDLRVHVSSSKYVRI